MQQWRWTCFVGLGMIWLVAAIGCEPGADSTRSEGPPPAPFEAVPPPDEKPRYRFAEGVEAKYPEIAGFMREFMETCLAGDYSGYRRLVTRTESPESRARFERILHALESLAVQRVEPITLPDTDVPAFLVTTEAHFRPEYQESLGQGPSRQVAILVVLEEGAWRMAFAPSELQPRPAQPAANTQPEPNIPEYPWDQGIDY